MSFETILEQSTIDDFTAQGLWQNRVLTDLLDEAAARTPDRRAVTDSRGHITYAELKAKSDRVALGLLENGIRPGDVISFQLPNWIEFVILHMACTRIGAVNNPLIPIYREREIGYMVGLAESKWLVVPSEFRKFDYVAMAESLRGDWPSLERLLVVDAKEGQDSWEEFVNTPWEERRDPAELAALRPDPNDVTLLMFTSGTTGEPKGVMHTHNTLIAANAGIPDRMGLNEESVIHMASTFAHLTGFLFGVRLAIQNGLHLVAQDVWNAQEFLGLVQEHKISYTSGATPFLHDLLSNLPEDTTGLQSLVRFCCMGAPIPRTYVREGAQKLPGMAILGGWGQTENGLITICAPGDPEEKVTSTDGFPYPGMEVRTVDIENNLVAPGTEGRLQARGAFMFVGYLRRLEMTRELFTEDGWFDTGDLAIMDEDGYISISGRTKDIIVRGGENIPVAYVENVLYENPDFRSVAVIGIPDPRLQERACACLVMQDGVEPYDLAKLREYLSAKGVAKQYWPEEVLVMDVFPTTPSGKIQKFHLRESAVKELA
ncbi:AMP-binding protein [Kribbia dieselivorans]|uniref:AMP-binding protein n=1 Tax=Kribbia dieselivorans TaxID=331526 RepID=UPI0008397A9C|nr:AMP-binding protein [Kribbia dieselivorans]